MFIKKNKITLNFFKKIYGVGSASLICFFNYYGVNIRLHILKPKQEFFSRIRILIDEITFRKTLKMKLIANRKFIIEKVKNYISLRHVFHYPVHGQRTHTNGKTRKKLKTKVPFLT
jgi:ribosomal protein S13